MVRSSIAAFSIGTSACSGPSRDDEAADMLGEMARKADQLARQGQRQAQPPVGGIEPGLADTVLLDTPPRPHPQTVPDMHAGRIG